LLPALDHAFAPDQATCFADLLSAIDDAARPFSNAFPDEAEAGTAARASFSE